MSLWTNLACAICGEYGHYAHNCPQLPKLKRMKDSGGKEEKTTTLSDAESLPPLRSGKYLVGTLPKTLEPF